MIETIIGAVIALIIAAFLRGKSSAKNEKMKEDIKSIREAKRNYEEVGRMGDDEQLAQFDRMRDERRKLL